jgi:hypothetical protein
MSEMKLPGTPSQPVPEPAPEIQLYHSQRYSLETHAPVRNGTDLMAKKDPDGNIRFWFRHWTWNGTETRTCQPTTREEAVRFIRNHIRKLEPVEGWNDIRLREYLPEVYSNV